MFRIEQVDKDASELVLTRQHLCK